MRGRHASPAPEPSAPSSTLPESPSAPGSRRLDKGFFDDYPAYFETSETSAFPWRLNLRHEAVITENADILAGARVLDVASHDGRWSFAALSAGAASVLGIEARPDLVEHSAANMLRYGVTDDRFEFRAGDIFRVLARDEVRVDVVLCLGFLYHTFRWAELMARFRETGARYVVIDTEVLADEPRPLVKLAAEEVARQGNAVPDDYSYGDEVLTGRPSVSALRLLGRAHGMELESFSDWSGLLRDNPDADQIRDYRIGRRVTARFRVTRPGSD